MAKLYFSYACVDAGKTTHLIQAAYNFQREGMKSLTLVSDVETRAVREGRLYSRVGISVEARPFASIADLREMVRGVMRVAKRDLRCVFVDEAQFCTHRQVQQLGRVVDELAVPVMAYGLRTDFRGDFFSGSEALLALADEIREIRSVCRCGRRATMNLRLDEKGSVVKSGEQTQIGGSEMYRGVCRRHWTEAMG